MARITNLKDRNKIFLAQLSEKDRKIIEQLNLDIQKGVRSQTSIIRQMRKEGYQYIGKGSTACVFALNDKLVIRISNGENGTGYEDWAAFSDKNANKYEITPRYRYLDLIRAPGLNEHELSGSIAIMERMLPLKYKEVKNLFSNRQQFLLFFATITNQVQDTHSGSFPTNKDIQKTHQYISNFLIDKSIFTKNDLGDLIKISKKMYLNDFSQSNMMYSPQQNKIIVTDPCFY